MLRQTESAFRFLLYKRRVRQKRPAKKRLRHRKHGSLLLKIPNIKKDRFCGASALRTD